MQTTVKKKNRQYLIDLQRWRSVIALIACCVTLVCTIIAVAASLIYYTEMKIALSDFFRYFTTLSNMVTALTSSFIIPFAINGIRKKRYVCPKWLSLLHYAGTIGTTMTFVFAMVFILPWDYEFAVGPRNLYLHVICPIAVLISFGLVEANYQFTRKNTLLCLIPFFIYSMIYLVMVVFVGEEKGGWEDMYMLNTFAPAWFSLPCSFLLVYLIAFAIRLTANKLGRFRQKKLLARWTDQMEPVEVNIEVYGLGRYNGFHDDENDLSIPYDILQALAARYSMDPAALMKVYTKGLLDAVRDKTSACRRGHG